MVFFVFFYLVLEETKARTRLMFVWVNLSAKPTFKKKKKKHRKKKKKKCKIFLDRL